MDNRVGFILKILVLSASIAIFIRYVSPRLAIPATPVTALSAVLLPSFIVAVLLGWRSRQQPKPQD